nr:hypothetical protein [Megavirus caiporensis]
MLTAILINLLLTIYNIQNLLWNIFFSIVPKICFIYFIDGLKKYNITFNYYSGINLSKFKNGIYYIKRYDITGINHFAFRGDISEISDYVPAIELLEYDQPKRKNVIFMNNNIPCDKDLAIIDNYKMNADYYPDVSISNLHQITKMLDIPCTHINIITLKPFRNQTIPIEMVKLNDIYVI